MYPIREGEEIIPDNLLGNREEFKSITKENHIQVTNIKQNMLVSTSLKK